MKRKAIGTKFETENDKFYTNPNIVKKVLNFFQLSEYDLIIEPSAGSGAFTKELKKYNSISYDLFPEDNNIIKGDWFKQKVPTLYKNVLIIGNPPFGKENNLSKDFIKHATSFENVTTIGFILPNVYRKHTLQSVIPKTYKITKIVELPKNSFTLSGELHHVPCSFFIFEKSTEKKDLRQNPNLRSKDFSFSNKNDYDFFIFGAAPKKIISEPKENNRGYFIKSNIDSKRLLERFKVIKWKGYSSANGGIYWLTKVDIVENYNRERKNFKERGI